MGNIFSKMVSEDINKVKSELVDIKDDIKKGLLESVGFSSNQKQKAKRNNTKRR